MAAERTQQRYRCWRKHSSTSEAKISGPNSQPRQANETGTASCLRISGTELFENNPPQRWKRREDKQEHWAPAKRAVVMMKTSVPWRVALRFFRAPSVSDIRSHRQNVAMGLCWISHWTILLAINVKACSTTVYCDT
jgi:hypothetical protein